MVIKMKYSVLAILAHLLTNIKATQEVFTLSDLPPDSCPIDSPISCSRNAQELENVNSCCYESPAGVILLTQFWDYNPATGPDNLFTQHGLWGNMCSYGYPQFCDPSLEINPNGEIIRSIIVDQFGDEELYNNMSYSWKDYHGKDSSFWAHEYNKHGTCFSTIKPSCYLSKAPKNQNLYDFFRIAIGLFNRLPTYDWLAEAGIVPTNSKTYSLSEIQSALNDKFGANVFIKCDYNHAINEIWYYHHVKGSLLQHNFLPIDSVAHTNCPSTGIKYPPKGKIAHPTLTTKTTTGTSTTIHNPTGIPARAYVHLSKKTGCLISNGKWYTSGTCATYHFRKTIDDSNIEIRSSKGICGINGNEEFTCSRAVSGGTEFQIKDGKIGYQDKFDWCFGSTTGSGSTAQTSVKLADGSCDSFQLLI